MPKFGTPEKETKNDPYLVNIGYSWPQAGSTLARNRVIVYTEVSVGHTVTCLTQQIESGQKNSVNRVLYYYSNIIVLVIHSVVVVLIVGCCFLLFVVCFLFLVSL